MNRDVLGWIANKGSLLKFLLLSTFVASGAFIVRGAMQVDQVGTVKQGTQTCFQRVFQTYTAHLIQSTTSQYLNSSFVGGTEECFGEANYQLEALNVQGLENAHKTLNNLASSVHWFHARVAGQGSEERVLDSGVTVSNIGERFRSLEDLRNRFNNQVDNRLASMRELNQNISYLFYMAGSLMFILLMLETFKRRSRLKLMRNLEAQALEYGNSYAGTNVESFNSLIYKALCENRLEECAKLFDRFALSNQRNTTAVIETKNQKQAELLASFYSFGKKTDQIGRSAIISKDSNEAEKEAKIDELWAQWTDQGESLNLSDQQAPKVAKVMDEERGLDSSMTPEEEVEDAIHLDAVLANSIDRLSESIFASNIKLHFDVDEEVYVKAEAEIVEQVVHQMMNGAILRLKNVENKDISPSLSLKIKRNGPSVVFEMIDNGRSIKSQSEDQAFDLEHKIVQELVRDVGGHLNVLYDGEFNTTKAFFKAHEIHNTSIERGKLVDLKKGSKREILENLEKSFTNAERP